MPFILTAILLVIPIFTHAAPPQIRVALVRETATLQLLGRNFFCYLPGTPDSERTRLPRQTAFVRHTGAGFMLDDLFLPGSELNCISGEGILTINTIPTQGHIAIFPDGPQKATAVATLPMEHYLIGVLQGEVSENWPTEALKAQAIASRSYALATLAERRGKLYDMVITTQDQAYSARIKIPTPLQSAVLDTQGSVLKYKNTTLKAFYHSCCGGAGVDFTTVAQDLSPHKTPSPFPNPTTKDPFCRKAPVKKWTVHMNEPDLVTALHSQSPTLASFNQLTFQTDDSGRVTTVTLPGKSGPIQISGNQFRKALGYETVRSTWFSAKQNGHVISFSGRGYGHGVGLCQWGAKGMAERGKSAAEILQFYYPGAEITKAY